MLDADVTPQDISDLVGLADHVAFSEPGLAKFAQTDDLLSGLRLAQTRTDGKVYVTAGADGCYWLENDTIQHAQGFKVNVLDTTGAGDVFHGAFAFALAQGMENAGNRAFCQCRCCVEMYKIWGARRHSGSGNRQGFSGCEPLGASLHKIEQPVLSDQVSDKDGAALQERERSRMSDAVIVGTPRQDKLLREVNERGYISVEELTELLDVSAQTIRRDIKKLSDQKLLIRHHGGAARNSKCPQS